MTTTPPREQLPPLPAEHGWLYDWTSSSSLGRQDEQYTSFTTDAKHAKQYENEQAIYTEAQMQAYAREAIAAQAASVEPVALHLKAYGYAPGGYMSTCLSCSTSHPDLDKRACRCRPCAEKLYAASLLSAPVAAVTAMVSLTINDVYTLIGEASHQGMLGKRTMPRYFLDLAVRIAESIGDADAIARANAMRDTGINGLTVGDGAQSIKDTP